tara:strand:+ start:702 stop:1022 length:321 start_codon:yes stop_codon:yes gene_type:complete
MSKIKKSIFIFDKITLTNGYYTKHETKIFYDAYRILNYAYEKVVDDYYQYKEKIKPLYDDLKMIGEIKKKIKDYNYYLLTIDSKNYIKYNISHKILNFEDNNFYGV